MAKLTRKVMKIYGENAADKDLIAYGSDIAGNIVETRDPNVIQTQAYSEGVRGAVIGSNSTTLQNRQVLDYLFSRQIKYLFQNGIPEWGADEVYYQFSVVRGSDGNLYGSITDNNVGQDPVEDTLHTNWRNFPTYQELDAKVNRAGDTMTGGLSVPAPSSDSNDTKVPTTSWVRNLIGGGAGLFTKIAPDWSAAVSIVSNASYTAPSDGWIFGYSGASDWNQVQLKVGDVTFLNSGRKSYNTPTCFCAFVGKGQTVVPRADNGALRFVPCLGE